MTADNAAGYAAGQVESHKLTQAAKVPSIPAVKVNNTKQNKNFDIHVGINKSSQSDRTVLYTPRCCHSGKGCSIFIQYPTSVSILSLIVKCFDPMGSCSGTQQKKILM